MRGGVGATLADDQRDVDLARGRSPAPQRLVVAAPPRVEGDGADIAQGGRVVQRRDDEVEGRGVGIVTQQHQGLEPLVGHVLAEILDEIPVLLGSVDYIDTQVGLVEGEVVGLAAILLLQVDEVRGDGLEDTVLFLWLEGVGAGGAVGAGGLVPGPCRREPSADDDRHSDLLEAAGHLGTAVDVVGGIAAAEAAAAALLLLSLIALGMSVLVPLAPGELDATEGHAEILEAIIDHLGVLLDVLDAEIAAETGEEAARIGSVEVDVCGLVVLHSGHLHHGGIIGLCALLQLR